MEGEQNEDKTKGKPKRGRESRWGSPFNVLFARCTPLCSHLQTLGAASTVLAPTRAVSLF